MLAGVLIAVLGSQVWLLAPLRALPSAVYGGDLYYQLGCIQRILATGNPMASCSTCETQPGYLPLYGTLVAAAATVTGMVERPEQAMLAMAVVLKLAAVLALVACLAPLAGLPAAVATAALGYATHPEPILRYTSFSAEVVVPLFLLGLVRLLERPGAGRAAMLALAIGALGYAHAVAFIGSVAITAIAAIARVLLAPREPDRRRALGWAAAAAAVGVVAALGYWWQPIFVHHGRTSPHYAEWNGGPDFGTLGARLGYAVRFAAAQFDRSSPGALLASLAVPVGFVVAWRRRRDPGIAPAMLVAAVAFAWVLHHLASVPLLGTHFIPDYVASMLWGTARWMPASVAIGALVALPRSPGARAASAAGATVVAIALASATVRSVAASDAMRASRQPLTPVYEDLRRWVRGHTRGDDVFLSSPELSFMLSALTGRPVLVTRRAQNDAFADLDVRVRDAALILYGDDDALRRARLARWKVRYLLWTERWVASEFDRDASGRVTGYFDPLLYFPDAAADSLLESAGVRLQHVTGWVDPSLRGPHVKRYALTLVSHENHRDAVRPWHASLDPRLRKVWSYGHGGREIAAIYRIDAP